MTRARLIATRVPAAPTAAVLVLHGGAARGEDAMVSATQLSVLRMVPIASRIAWSGRGRLAVFRLLNSARGWDTGRTPVDDVGWAMGRLRERFGLALPTGLVGHSLGGRAALLAAEHPDVRTAVALAPWVYPSDGDADLEGRQVLIVHGDRDRVADPAKSAVVAERLRRTTDVGYVRVAGAKHAMLRHGSVFDRLAADFTTATLLGDTVSGPVGEVLTGQPWVDV